MPLSYSVTATLPDAATRDEYVEWLAEGHVRQVIDAGASEGWVIRIDDPEEPLRVESRYIFPTSEAFRAYVEHHAPALREDGLRRFGGRGVGFERRVGTVLEPGEGARARSD